MFAHSKWKLTRMIMWFLLFQTADYFCYLCNNVLCYWTNRMFIKKLKLNGYKRFKSLTIDLGEHPKRIVALVGPNGCGKSSVFDGMLFHCEAYGQLGNKGSKDFHYHSIDQIPSYSYQQVEIEFTDGSFQLVWDKKNKEGKSNTIFSFRSPYRYNSNLRVSQSRAVSELRLNNYGASLSSDIDDKMEENYRRLNIKYNNYRLRANGFLWRRRTIFG